MFSADSELTEEDFIHAALLLENDLVENGEVNAIGKQTGGNSTAQKSVSLAADFDGGQTGHFAGELVESVPNSHLVPETKSIFCLSQDCDFDDELSDDILFNQLTAYSNSLADSKDQDILNNKSAEISWENNMKSVGRVPVVEGNVVTVQSQHSSSCNPMSVSHSFTRTDRKDMFYADFFNADHGLDASCLLDDSTRRRGNPVMVASVNCRKSPPIARKRKFPGPAGVLPKLKSGSFCSGSLLETGLLAVTGDKNEISGQPAESGDVIITSQASGDDFFNGDAWRSMLKDLEPNAERILSQFSARSIIEMQHMWLLMPRQPGRQLALGKVPVFCAVIESVTARGADACVTLVDPSGKISGTVHRELIKEYTSCFQAGTVIVLRQVSLLSPLGRNYYLNITPNNVVRLYPRNESGNLQSAINLRELSKDDLQFAVPPRPQVTPHRSETTGVPPRPQVTPHRPETSGVPPRPQVAPHRPETTGIRPASKHHVMNMTPASSFSSSVQGLTRHERHRLSPKSAVWPQTVSATLRQSTPVPQPASTTNDRRSLFVSTNTPNRLPITSTLCAVSASGGSQFSSGAHRSVDSRTQSQSSNSFELTPAMATSSGTPRFTFKRALTMQESPTVDRITNGSTGTPVSRGVVGRSLPLGDRSNRDDSQTPIASTKHGGPSSADIWKTEDIDDDVLFNLSAELLSDF